jgi:hypothetical protein
VINRDPVAGELTDAGGPRLEDAGLCEARLGEAKLGETWLGETWLGEAGLCTEGCALPAGSDVPERAPVTEPGSPT